MDEQWEICDRQLSPEVNLTTRMHISFFSLALYPNKALLSKKKERGGARQFLSCSVIFMVSESSVLCFAIDFMNELLPPHSAVHRLKEATDLGPSEMKTCP